MVSKLLILYVTVVRKLELSFSKELNIDVLNEGATYLFWRESGKLNPDQIRVSITRCLSNFEVNLSFSSFRHVCKGFMRHHVKEENINYVDQFGHSQKTGERYGKSSKENQKFEELEQISKKVSFQWHKLLEIK